MPKQRSGSTDRPMPIMGDDHRSPINNNGLKPKDLIGIPWRVAFALQKDGWWLRSDIVWEKLNPMPESVRDRPTRVHEYVFLLTKSERYFYDADAIREPAAPATLNDSRVNGQGFVASMTNPDNPHYAQASKPDKQRGHSRRHAGFNDRWDVMTKEEQQAMGANKRTVWRISTQGFPGAHFATFPEKLVEPCILAGTIERGVCGKCGAPWMRTVVVDDPEGRLGKGYHDHTDDLGRGQRGVFSADGRPTRTTTGWQPTCDHDAPAVPAIVLDPFAGSGTTLAVAQRLGRRAIGVDLNADYLKLAAERIGSVSLPMALV